MKYTIAACLILVHLATVGQTRQKLNIDDVTVFLSGAELLSSASLNLVKGENEILFTNVAGDVNSQSLTVSATNGVVVESATFLNNYLADETISPHAREIKDSIDLLNEVKNQVSDKLTVIAEQIAVLQGNRRVGGDNTGLSVTELGKMLDLVSTRMDACLKDKSKQDVTLKKINERLTRLNNQLDEEHKKAYQPGGMLRIKFYAREATGTSININYIVPHAGWTPTYDIFADDIHSPVKLYYKANIYQNSGVNWNNVHLSLSTGNPNEGIQAPGLNPWYLSFYVPPAQNRSGDDKRLLIDRDAAMIPTTEVADLVAMAPGVYQQQASINNYVTVDNSGVNTTFDIDLPYTIPSDGQEHLVAVKKYELPATYRYFVVPKADKDAFLQALVTKWEDLNLLPGKSNIFYEGTYVGQGNLDVRNLADTMYFSLGRDKKIVVKREQDVKMRSVKTIGSNVRETFAFTISIRNTRKDPINLIVQDQLPVSNDKDIVVEDKETAGSEYDEKSGMMKWTLQVAANETQKLQFGYTVKYPKGKTVVNLR